MHIKFQWIINGLLINNVTSFLKTVLCIRLKWGQTGWWRLSQREFIQQQVGVQHRSRGPCLMEHCGSDTVCNFQWWEKYFDLLKGATDFTHEDEFRMTSVALEELCHVWKNNPDDVIGVIWAWTWDFRVSQNLALQTKYVVSERWKHLPEREGLTRYAIEVNYGNFIGSSIFRDWLKPLIFAAASILTILFGHASKNYTWLTSPCHQRWHCVDVNL